ncbi:MAG: hypothetical protein KGJ90_04165 [Patescibacteria group bacterium]|nr:hypothetical protein [Patescibacteria group bacterium]
MLSSDDPFALNIAGVRDLSESPTNKISKGTGTPNGEGASGMTVDVLDLPMEDSELLELRDRWEEIYLPYQARIEEIWKRNLRSYLGRTSSGAILDNEFPTAANLQFEAEETFLPAATARNPDPYVFSDDTPEGNKIASDVQTMLQFHAAELLMRRKLAVMVRQWSIYHLGVIKIGWDTKINDLKIENRKIQDFIFDPTGYVDSYGHFSSWLGERMACTAEELAERFPKQKSYIAEEAQHKMGTKVIYTEWWTNEYTFTTFKEKVLDKNKNQFFNYPETSSTEKDEYGISKIVEARNHFAAPLKPYVFLSVFTLQERPHDITGLIEQNVATQRKISDRTEELDTILRQAVNGLAFSMDNFNQETAKQAAQALSNPDKGKVLVPPGKPINEAIARIPIGDIPDAFFDDLEVNKNNLRASWGIQGIASQKQTSDTTARGMILNQQRDTSRIGGGITDVLEQSVAKSIFDWFVQIYMTTKFYDDKHFGAILGTGKGVEYVELTATDIDRQLVVGVTADSMKPKDEISQMNQAMALYQEGVIGPKKLLEMQKFPDADDAAADGVLWATDKKAYLQLNFPELWQQLQQIAAQQTPAPEGAQTTAPQGEPASAQMAQMAQSLPAIPPAGPSPVTPEVVHA